MIHQLSGGAWGVVTRRIFGAASRVLPVLTLLYLPLLFGLHDLYEWTHHEVVEADPILSGKARYLNAVLHRAPSCTLPVWNAIAYFLNRWSLEQDRSPRPAHRAADADAERRRTGRLWMTITFASFDWVMSLDPHWFSTIYGVLFMGGQGHGAGVPRHRAGLAEPTRTAQHHRRAHAFPRSRQPDARLRDALGLFLVLAIPDHLLGGGKDHRYTAGMPFTGWRR